MDAYGLFWILCSLLCLMTSLAESRSRSGVRGRSRNRGQRLDFPQSDKGSRQPNIILVLTDDQDVVLGKFYISKLSTFSFSNPIFVLFTSIISPLMFVSGAGAEVRSGPLYKDNSIFFRCESSTVHVTVFICKNGGLSGRSIKGETINCLLTIQMES